MFQCIKMQKLQKMILSLKMGILTLMKCNRHKEAWQSMYILTQDY